MSCNNNYLTEWVSSDPILKSLSMSLSPFCRISVRRTCWNKAILISATEGALSLVTNSKISVTILCAVLIEITEEDSLGVVGGGGCTAVAVTGGVPELPGKLSPVFITEVLVLDESCSFWFCYNFSAAIPMELWFLSKIF